MFDQIQSCLTGLAIGDAMGMPWELMTAEEISQATGGKGVTGFSAPVQRKLKDTMNLAAGDTTDDWQLARAILLSILRMGRFDREDIALAHVEALDSSRFGWGGTTTQGVKRLKQSIANGQPIPDSLDYFQLGKGTGNGVAMKIAAVATHYMVEDGRLDELWPRVFTIGKLTHPDIRASISAFTLAHLITRCLVAGPIRGSKRIRIELEDLIEATEWIENRTRHIQSHDDIVSKRLQAIYGNLYSASRLREVMGCSCFCLESVPFSIAIFLRHPTDFKKAVLEAVNAGGDTDTNAAMVGALVGANCGLSVIPKEWLAFRPHFQEPIELGQQLYNKFQ